MAFTVTKVTADAAGDAPPPSSSLEDEDDALAGLYAAAMESGPGSDERERSSNLWADPKMRELKHFFKSHKHEKKLRERMGLEERSGSRTMGQSQSSPALGGTIKGEAPSADRRDSTLSAAADVDAGNGLRTDGCEKVDAKLKKLAREKVSLPLPVRHRELPFMVGATQDAKTLQVLAQNETTRRAEQAKRLKQLSGIDARLNWRHCMDDSLQRLLIDMELSEDDKDNSHKARCGHLDKIYDWYLIHGQKEARKERAGPPYVLFNASGPVMPGSLRPAPKTHEPPAASVSAATRRSSRPDMALPLSSSMPTLAGVGDASPSSKVSKDAKDVANVKELTRVPTTEGTMRPKDGGRLGF